MNAQNRQLENRIKQQLLNGKSINGLAWYYSVSEEYVRRLANSMRHKY